jgi:hypothetical protein
MSDLAERIAELCRAVGMPWVQRGHLRLFLERADPPPGERATYIIVTDRGVARILAPLQAPFYGAVTSTIEYLPGDDLKSSVWVLPVVQPITGDDLAICWIVLMKVDPHQPFRLFPDALGPFVIALLDPGTGPAVPAPSWIARLDGMQELRLEDVTGLWDRLTTLLATVSCPGGQEARDE